MSTGLPNPLVISPCNDELISPTNCDGPYKQLDEAVFSFITLATVVSLKGRGLSNAITPGTPLPFAVLPGVGEVGASTVVNQVVS